MTLFEVLDVLDVPVTKGRGGTLISVKEAKARLSASAAGHRRGCYIFAFKAGRGFKPVYVGKATKTFADECFATHKLEKLQHAFADRARGILRLILIAQPTAKTSRVTIDALETYLIEEGFRVNELLLNVQKKPLQRFAIKGAYCSPAGKPTTHAQTLKKVFKW